MVRFGVLSNTFWSIGVDLVAGAVFKGPKTTSNRLTPARMAWKANSSTKIMERMAWKAKSSTKIVECYAWGANSLTKIVVCNRLGREFLDENSVFSLLEGLLG